MEYQRSRRIGTSPDDVFAFVTNVNNVPSYVPTVESVESLDDEDRVRVQGKVGDSDFDEEIWFHVDHNQPGIEWGADNHDYRGWMTLTSADDDATQVVAHLSWPPHVNQDGAPLDGEPARDPDPVEAALEGALDSLRNLMEGTGGKAEPRIIS